MRPPCISTISLAMARPSPVPPLARVFELSTWRNFSKIRSHSSGIPGPVSLTLRVNRPLAAPGCDAYLPGVGELDGVADEVEQHLG
jgi:hypothetical protein